MSGVVNSMDMGVSVGRTPNHYRFFLLQSAVFTIGETLGLYAKINVPLYSVAVVMALILVGTVILKVVVPQAFNTFRYLLVTLFMFVLGLASYLGAPR